MGETRHTYKGPRWRSRRWRQGVADTCWEGHAAKWRSREAAGGSKARSRNGEKDSKEFIRN